MTSHKKTARIIGVLMIVAYGTIGVFFLESKLSISILEIISGLAVIGAAILFFPILKPHNKNLTLTYTLIKLIEGAFLVIGAFLLLASSAQATQLRNLLTDSGVYLFGTRFLILAIIFYQSRLVPRLLAVWALVASVALMGSFLITAVNPGTIVSPAISHFPVISNELLLALWLIVKGFNPSAIAPESVKADS